VVRYCGIHTPDVSHPNSPLSLQSKQKQDKIC
jgi:hypothetical protein